MMRNTNQIRFRASIYADVFVRIPDGIAVSPASIEIARDKAFLTMYEHAITIPNAYVGGLAQLNGLTLDREI